MLASHCPQFESRCLSRVNNVIVNAIAFYVHFGRDLRFSIICSQDPFGIILYGSNDGSGGTGFFFQAPSDQDGFSIA